jgi:hypothetical protein
MKVAINCLVNVIWKSKNYKSKLMKFWNYIYNGIRLINIAVMIIIILKWMPTILKF